MDLLYLFSKKLFYGLLNYIFEKWINKLSFSLFFLICQVGEMPMGMPSGSKEKEDVETDLVIGFPKSRP